MASNSVSNKRKKGSGKDHSDGPAERISVADESQRDYGSLGDVANEGSSYMTRGASQMRELARDHKAGAVVMAVAAGLGIGVLVGCALAKSHRNPATWRDRIMAEGLGKRLMERIDGMIPEVLAERFGKQ